MSMTRFLVMSVVAALLAGCSELPYYNNGGFAPVIDSGRGVNRWLDDLRETRAMPPELLRQTLEVWDREFQENPTVNNRMRLVLLLATREPPVGDRERARELLVGFDAEAASDSECELVDIMWQSLDEISEKNSKINEVNKIVADRDRRIEELEQQLQALTTIEQHIQQRDKTGDD